MVRSTGRRGWTVAGLMFKYLVSTDAGEMIVSQYGQPRLKNKTRNASQHIQPS